MEYLLVPGLKIPAPNLNCLAWFIQEQGYSVVHWKRPRVASLSMYSHSSLACKPEKKLNNLNP